MRLAIGVLGHEVRPHPVPWMIGHEQDKTRMDDENARLKEDRWYKVAERRRREGTG